MAHDLATDVRTGEVAMFFNLDNGAPWHHLGTGVRGCLTWQEAMQKAHLDYEVVKERLSAPARFGGALIPTWGMFRADTGAFLGSAGANYTPIQNKMAFEFVDALLSVENGAHYESAGALGHGERLWCLARIPRDIIVAGTEDRHLNYLLFSTSHDGSLAAQAKITTIRVVCRNTLTAAVNGNGQMMRVKHTKEAQARLDAARKLMSTAVTGIKSLEEKFNLLALRKMTRDSYTAIMDRLFPKPKDAEAAAPDSWRRKNSLEEIAHLFADNDGNAVQEIRGTAYSVLNSITNYVDHSRMTRVTDSRPANYTPTLARSESALFGSGANLKENALQIVLEETEKNPARDLKPISMTVPHSDLLDEVLAETANRPRA